MSTRASEILITIPRCFQRDDVLRQLYTCSHPGVTWHYCVNRLPREMPARMHFLHDGQIIGSLPVVNMGEYSSKRLIRADGSTLKQRRRFAIRAAGIFRPQTPPIFMKGFRGWRFFHEDTGRCRQCGGLGAVDIGTADERPCDVCVLQEAAP